MARTKKIKCPNCQGEISINFDVGSVEPPKSAREKELEAEIEALKNPPHKEEPPKEEPPKEEPPAPKPDVFNE